jgi:hypothetical protein
MTSRQTFIETVLPVVNRLAQSSDKLLAAEAADEAAKLSKELARLKRAAADQVTMQEGSGREAAMGA